MIKNFIKENKNKKNFFKIKANLHFLNKYQPRIFNGEKTKYFDANDVAKPIPNIAHKDETPPIISS